jgi:6-phosphogluconate dehydrogenase
MENAQIGVIGLGVMGSSLAKNLITHGIKTTLFSINQAEREKFYVNKFQSNYIVCGSINDFVEKLEKPRKILLMITAGNAVDSVAESLALLLDRGDIIIDGGNSYYEDTNRRKQYYKQLGIEFVGLGISGGEKGALEGPSMMFGGSRYSWTACKDILQKIAAVYNGHSCCGYVSEEGSGHYVKMVHNGIEYGNLQLIAEAYYFMTNGLRMSCDECADVFANWSKGRLSSYLIEIAAIVLRKKDDDGQNLVEKIKDVAGQKGTGKWTLQEGLDRKIYIPTIFEAVSIRNYSEARQYISNQDNRTNATNIDRENMISGMEKALYISQLCCYAQGIELIGKASADFGWNIDLADMVSLWENGCIIRSEIIGDIAEALRADMPIEKRNILLMEKFKDIKKDILDYRSVIAFATMNGISLPALRTSLSYYEVYQMDKLPINLIQGLRDCFGAHTYERVDKTGAFHTNWE